MSPTLMRFAVVPVCDGGANEVYKETTSILYRNTKKNDDIMHICESARVKYCLYLQM